MENALLVNHLGELLARRQVTRVDLEEFLSQFQPPEATDHQKFWQEIWDELLGEGTVDVPPFPSLKSKTTESLDGRYGRWFFVFIPAIKEQDYPDSFIKPSWGQHLDVDEIKRRKLPGRWVVIETIPKPDWDDPNGYGDDPLALALSLQARFSLSWDELHETHLPAVAKLLGLRKKAVRLPTAEEWNLLGNLFLWLNEHKEERLPDLGSTNSWEWCENAYGGGGRLVVGRRGGGGLAVVDGRWSDDRSGRLGFRVLAVL